MRRRRRARTAAAFTACLLAAGLAGSTTQAGLLAAGAAETPVAAAVTPAKAVTGKPMAVTATLADPAWVGRTVRLEQSFFGVWLPALGVGEVVAESTEVSFRVPTGWYGARDFQVVVVDADGTELGRSTAVASSVVPAYAPRGKASMKSFFDGTPRWNPCQPITWKANVAKAPKGALADLRGAVKRIEQGTGIDFVYTGKSGTVPTRFAPVAGQDLLVAWAPKTSPLLRKVPRNVIALAMPFWYLGGQSNADGSNASEICNAAVVVDTRYNTQLRKGFGRGITRGEVLVHELAHTMGLGHTNSETQVMNPYVTKRDANWGAGDLSGLERLGANRGCITPDSGRRAGQPVAGTIID